jgi:hypothetical protein
MPIMTPVGRRVDTHRVRDLSTNGISVEVLCEGARTYIVQELGSSVTLYVVTVKVTPSQLNIDPELVAGSAIHLVLVLLKWRKLNRTVTKTGLNIRR